MEILSSISFSTIAIEPTKSVARRLHSFFRAAFSSLIYLSTGESLFGSRTKGTDSY